MTKKKPQWAITDVPWDIKKVIWQRWALGETPAATLRYFELNAGMHKGAPWNRDTIAKVRKEFTRLPAELVKRLITELPEIESFVKEQRPDLKNVLQSPDRGHDQQVQNMVLEEAPLILEARKKHFEDICNSIEMLEGELRNIYQSGISITTIPPECLEGHKGETVKALAARSGEAFLVLFKDGLLREIYLRTEYTDPVFHCLRSHMHTEVWNLFERFRDSLKQCLQQQVYKSVGSDKYSRSLYSASVREMVSVAQSLIAELQKYRYRRVFPGKCDYCP